MAALAQRCQAVATAPEAQPARIVRHNSLDKLDGADALRPSLVTVATGAAAFVACPFVGESKMWQHYELVTRDFYVFHEIEELLP